MEIAWKWNRGCLYILLEAMLLACLLNCIYTIYCHLEIKSFLAVGILLHRSNVREDRLDLRERVYTYMQTYQRRQGQGRVGQGRVGKRWAEQGEERRNERGGKGGVRKKWEGSLS